MLRRSSGLVAAVIFSLVALGTVPLAASANLKADYRFEGDLKSSTGGVPKLVKQGAGDFVKQQVKGSHQKVLKYEEGTCLRLGDARKALGTPGTYTFVLLIRLDSVGGYRKLIDFDNQQQDAGLYVDDKTLHPYDLDYSDEVIKRDRWYQLALTRDGDGDVRGYVDGDRVVKAGDPAEDLVLGPDEFLHFLCDDETQGDEESGGMIGRLRIFNDALSDKQIHKLGT